MLRPLRVPYRAHSSSFSIYILRDGFARLSVLSYPVHGARGSPHQAQEAVLRQGTLSISGFLWSTIFLLPSDWRADL